MFTRRTSATSQTAGLSFAFSQPAIAGDEVVTLTVGAPAGVAPWRYPAVVTARAGDAVRSQEIVVIVGREPMKRRRGTQTSPQGGAVRVGGRAGRATAGGPPCRRVSIMPMAASTDSDRAPLLAAICGSLAGVRFAYVFGSVLGEGFNAESDLDVAVDCGRRLGFEEVDDLRRRCAEATGRDVDLVDLFAADPIIRMQVVRHGEPVVVNDRHALAVFAMLAVSEYLDFKIDRRGIEAAMREPHVAGG